MRNTILSSIAVGALLVAGGCATSDVYQVTVVDRSTAKPVENATVEMTADAQAARGTTESTNQAGEASFALWSDRRYFFTVTFDGDTDRYLLRTESVPFWNDTPVDPDGPSSPTRFAPGPPSTGQSPSWLVRVVRLR
jgi:hypothetical protein